ncbi:MAG TPA: hypothetical protein VKE24_11380 [Candidatus Acidoferrales bacterium]|nr:hypothetical protein [Candidatus Acidoferrales bacterium]
MKRILTGGILLGSLMLLQTIPARVAQEKPPERWQAVADFKVLRLWDIRELGPRWPEIAILQLSNERRKELEDDSLAFLRKYQIFKQVEEVRGHFELRLLKEKKEKAAGNEPYVVIVVHDESTYAGFGAFGVARIQ